MSWTPSASTPRWTRSIAVDGTTASCNTATGCLPAEGFAKELALTYEAVAKEGVWIAASKLEGSASIGPTGELTPRSAGRPIRGRMGTRSWSIDDVTVDSPLAADGVTLTRTRIVGTSGAFTAPTTYAHSPAKPPLPTVPELTPRSDASVLAMFAPGTLEKPLGSLPLVQAGFRRYCHPLTGCTAPLPVDVRSACAPLVDAPRPFLVAKVRAANRYRLDGLPGESIDITDGRGTWQNTRVIVGEKPVRLIFPPSSTPADPEVGETSCTIGVLG